MDLDLVRWNGNVMSAKSCAFMFFGVPYTGIQALDYSEKLEAELVHGTSKDGTPIGYSSGEYSVDAFSFQILKDAWISKMLPHMAAISAALGSPGSYGGARFPLVAQYQEGPLVGTDTLEGCRIVGVKDTYAQGTGKLVTECTCMALMLRRNGLTLASLTRLP